LILTGGISPEQGPADATLRLAVFTDYRCPACRHALRALTEAAERDGKVRMIYKDWPILGPPSERAASIALGCAEQGIYPAVPSPADDRQSHDRRRHAVGRRHCRWGGTGSA
jgi:protein-disulfide isomerase